VSTSRWIGLHGAVNARDLGGLPTVDGTTTRRDRLIRSDNLQGLTARDVRTLVDVHGVRAIADLRTGAEVNAEGPSPMTREPAVRVVHISLFPEAGELTDAAALDEGAGANVLPWTRRAAERDARGETNRRGAAQVYLGYLDDRPDSVVDALRLIATSGGATIVHCAAGKDRTGVITAFALSEVGVTREAIITDYVASGEHIDKIIARLRSSATYADDLRDADPDRHRPRAETMQQVLDVIDTEHGGAGTWLRAHGWSEADAAALRTHLLA
jgi:protein tyrosine/serine phosphatase